MAIGCTFVVCALGYNSRRRYSELLKGTVLAGAGQHGGPVWGGSVSREEIMSGLSSSFWLSVTHYGLFPVAVIACVTLLNESYMENHPSLDSILFWKTQGPSTWETLCTCSSRNRNHMSWNSRCLSKMSSKLTTLETQYFGMGIWLLSFFFRTVVSKVSIFSGLLPYVSVLPASQGTKQRSDNLIGLQ